MFIYPLVTTVTKEVVRRTYFKYMYDATPCDAECGNLVSLYILCFMMYWLICSLSVLVNFHALVP